MLEELTLTLHELTAQIRPQGTFNYLLSNGQALWSHASTRLYYLERQHPFVQAHLSDEDLELDFASRTSVGDRVAVIVTSPLTSNETWTAFEPGDPSSTPNRHLRLFLASGSL